MQIEKGIPIPTAFKGNLNAVLRKLEPGDSFVSPLSYDSTRSAASKIGIERGWKFTCRKVARDGIRVWRVA